MIPVKILQNSETANSGNFTKIKNRGKTNFRIKNCNVYLHVLNIKKLKFYVFKRITKSFNQDLLKMVMIL